MSAEKRKELQALSYHAPDKALVRYSSKAEAVEAAKKLSGVKIKGM